MYYICMYTYVDRNAIDKIDTGPEKRSMARRRVDHQNYFPAVVGK